MLWVLVAVLVVLWLLGLALDLVGALIHILLVVAAIFVIVELVRRARTST